MGSIPGSQILISPFSYFYIMKFTSGIKVILFVLLIAFCFCQKKLFEKVVVGGRVLNFWTKEPLQETVSLMGDDVTSAKESQYGTMLIASGTPDVEGYFVLRGRASKRNHYCIRAGESDRYQTTYFSITGSNYDVGDLYGGEHDFYCKVQLQSVTTNSITIEGSTYGTGTNTILLKKTLAFNNYLGGYQFFFRLSNSDRDSLRSLSITNSDTVFTSIKY
jgi:hypothetical protein